MTGSGGHSELGDLVVEDFRTRVLNTERTFTLHFKETNILTFERDTTALWHVFTVLIRSCHLHVLMCLMKK